MNLSRIAVALSVAQLLVGIAMVFAANAEGRLGGFAYAGMYAVPLALLALALRSRRRAWHLAAGWVALAFGVFYTAVVAANWAGYTTAQAAAVIVVTTSTVAVDALIFWSQVIAFHAVGAASEPRMEQRRVRDGRSTG